MNPTVLFSAINTLNVAATGPPYLSWFFKISELKRSESFWYLINLTFEWVSYFAQSRSLLFLTLSLQRKLSMLRNVIRVTQEHKKLLLLRLTSFSSNIHFLSRFFSEAIAQFFFLAVLRWRTDLSWWRCHLRWETSLVTSWNGPRLGLEGSGLAIKRIAVFPGLNIVQTVWL